jgi:hypothetical protein
VSATTVVVALAVCILRNDRPDGEGPVQATRADSAIRATSPQASHQFEARRDAMALDRDTRRRKKFAAELPVATKLLDDPILNPQRWRLTDSDVRELDQIIAVLNAERSDLKNEYATLADECVLNKIETGNCDIVENGSPRPLTAEEEAKHGRVMVLSMENQPTKSAVVCCDDSRELAAASSHFDDLAAEAQERVDEYLKSHGKHDE